MIGLPEWRPLPEGCLAVNHGPLFYGSTQVAQFRRLWAVWNSATAVRLGPYLQPLYDAWGNELDLLKDGGVWLRPAHLALAFDQDALPVVAFQKTTNTVSVRRYVTSVKTEYTFTGYSPVLFYNGVALVFTTVTDVVCLYLNSTGTALFARFQRENFGTEHLVNNFPPGLVLTRLQQASRVRVRGTNYMQLWAIADDGRQVTLRSKFYDPDLITEFDRLSNDVSADGGEQTSPLVIVGDSDSMTTDVATDTGLYIPQAVIVTAPGDKLTGDTTADGGAVVSTVVTRGAADKLTDDVTGDGGDITQKIFHSPNPTDKLTLDISADSGTYP